jgi:hypothetical protein
MQFGTPFTYQFKQPDFIKKILLTGLIMLIPVVGQLYLLGWGVEIARRVINDEADLLPGVEFGPFIGKGFKAFIIQFVYALPAIILAAPAYFFPLAADNKTFTTILIILSVICGCLTLIYAIFMLFMSPAALGNLAVENTIGAGFQFGKLIGLVRAAPVAYLLVIVGQLIGSIVPPLVGTLVCGVGNLFTIPYASSMAFHFVGQAYKVATAAKAALPPPAPAA